MYVEELIGPDTVDTMPRGDDPRPSRITAQVEPTLERGLDEAQQRARRRSREAGVDYDDVVETLEREGVEKFADSFDELLEGIRKTQPRARHRVGAPHGRRDRRDRRADLGARRRPSGPAATRTDWLGWLDGARPRCAGASTSSRRSPARSHEGGLTDVVLAGMGGSSLAPEVFRRTFDAEDFHVLDTTHPDAIRALEARARPRAHALRRRVQVGLDARDAAATSTTSGSGRGGGASRFVAVTDPGSRARGPRARARLPGRVAGRARDRRALLGALRLRARAGGAHGRRPRRACSSGRTRWSRRAGFREGNPGLELGLALGAGWREGRDKVLRRTRPGRIRALGRAAHRRVDRQGGQGPRPGAGRALRRAGPPGARRSASADPYELGQEFFRWEFATAVAGSIIGINPFDQPNVQEAKDRDEGDPRLGRGAEPRAGRLAWTSSSSRRGRATTSACRRSSSRRRTPSGASRRCASASAARPGSSTTAGFGPRYLHSTGQLHKGGPPSGLFLQVVDEPEELPIPGRTFGFGRLIRAQAAGDFDALRERGRRVARMRLEELG